MTDLLPLLVLNIPSILSLAAATALAIQEKEGWGWFLFIAALLATSPQ